MTIRLVAASRLWPQRDLRLPAVPVERDLRVSVGAEYRQTGALPGLDAAAIPKLIERIRDTTRISHTFERCLARLETNAAG